MADLISKLKKTIEDSFDIARSNAQNFKEVAGEYGKSARLKFDIVQMKSTMKKKMNLLGESVYPFLLKNNYNGLKEHETLRILIDDIKLLQSEIDLAEKTLEQMTEKVEPRPEFDRQQVRDQIHDLEEQIESRINDLKSVKEALDKDDDRKGD